MKRSLMAVAGLALAMSAPAHAQMRDKVSFGFQAGASMPSGDLKDIGGSGIEAKMGYTAAASIAVHRKALPVDFRADFAYQSLGVDCDGCGNFTSMGVDLNGVWNVSAMASTVSPYIVGGVGYHSTDWSECPSGSNCQKSNPAFQVGAGAKFMLSGFSTFIEAKYKRIMTKEEDTGLDGFVTIPITFGVMF